MEISENQEIFIFLVGASAIMLLLALVVMFIFFLSHKKISDKNSFIQQREIQHQAELLNYTIQTTESERKRFATDLHDDIGTKLSILRFQVEKWGNEYASEKSESVENIVKSIHDIGLNVRRISHNIMPASLELFGLKIALNELFENLNMGLRINFEFKCSSEFNFPVDHSLNLYRVIEELCNNSLKHSSAKNVLLRADDAPDHWRIRYEDDGIGFNDQVSQGLGIRSVGLRLQNIGAEYSWSDSKVKGMFLDMKIWKT